MGKGLMDRMTGKLGFTQEQAAAVAGNFYSYAYLDMSESSWSEIDAALLRVRDALVRDGKIGG